MTGFHTRSSCNPEPVYKAGDNPPITWKKIPTDRIGIEKGRNPSLRPYLTGWIRVEVIADPQWHGRIGTGGHPQSTGPTTTTDLYIKPSRRYGKER